MPRATGPAVDAATPDPAEAVTPSAPTDLATGGEVTAEPLPAWGNWRYNGPAGRIYANVPVTCYGGEVIVWLTAPADDGCWVLTTDPVTTHPDNHRPEPEPEPEKEA